MRYRFHAQVERVGGERETFGNRHLLPTFGAPPGNVEYGLTLLLTVLLNPRKPSTVFRTVYPIGEKMGPRGHNMPDTATATFGR